ncbi:MAG: 50S ribosomal protein L32 [Candidatus Magasanikbacteria bacterium]|nr:50S ribosomal protein L32 [Candidatus Magasanikbacteria bacterium]MCA9389588.1 50S ribosomal protein L32 [Candidatus Magasanikbacteria bacterium]MCA9390741.1 50S ribosomal protein L32 [Candidatus Magasanikbacteria bacterium]USN52272.1 MAG: 50S ribosomal protein L32 [Candidatus Nomurabacteria bacterium]HPF95102.1 50S ribosomal protein L32 [bacterium]
MGLPGHRRTSSHKRRRASHFALTAPALSTDKANRTHRMHVAAPGATEYNGIKIHVKGLERKLRKLVAKTKSHDHDHAGHEHADHAHDEKAPKIGKTKPVAGAPVSKPRRTGSRSK